MLRWKQRGIVGINGSICVQTKIYLLEDVVWCVRPVSTLCRHQRIIWGTCFTFFLSLFVTGTWTLKVAYVVCRQALEEGRSVAIDNTNPSRKARKQYVGKCFLLFTTIILSYFILEVAQNYNVPVRCLWFQTSEEHSKRLNWIREVRRDMRIHRTLMVSSEKREREMLVSYVW